MSRKAKGSILITTLIVFTIISTICIMCIGLIYSNNNISNLEYKTVKLRELASSGIELAHINILEEVKSAISCSNSKEEFDDYFVGNNSYEFLYNIKNISKNELDNVLIKIPDDHIYKENEFLKFDIISSYKENNYKKSMKASVEIKNPWYENLDEEIIDNKLSDSLDNSNNINLLDNDLDGKINETPKDAVDNENSIIDIKENLNERDLVKVYNYKEM